MLKILINGLAGVIKGTRSVTNGAKSILDQATVLANKTQETERSAEFAEKNYHMGLFLKTQHLLMPKHNDKLRFSDDGQRMRYLFFIFGAIDQLSKTVKDDDDKQMWAETSMLAHATITYPVDEAIAACKMYGRTGDSELDMAGERGFYAMNTFILASVERATKEEFNLSTTEMYDVVTRYTKMPGSV